MTRTPTYEELKGFAEMAMVKQPDALKLIKKHKLVFSTNGDKWQKLAFTLYTDLLELNVMGKQLFGDYD